MPKSSWWRWQDRCLFRSTNFPSLVATAPATKKRPAETGDARPQTRCSCRPCREERHRSAPDAKSVRKVLQHKLIAKPKCLAHLFCVADNLRHNLAFGRHSHHIAGLLPDQTRRKHSRQVVHSHSILVLMLQHEHQHLQDRIENIIVQGRKL